MAADADPERRQFRLKAREFERENSPAPPPAGKDNGPAKPDAGRIDVRDLFQQANLCPAGKAAPAGKPNEVHALLALNARKAAAAGTDDLAPKPRRASRRRRDYWISLLGGCGAVAAAVALAGANPISLLFGFGGVVVLVTGLTWVFWFVMDDY